MPLHRPIRGRVAQSIDAVAHRFDPPRGRQLGRTRQEATEKGSGRGCAARGPRNGPDESVRLSALPHRE